jgi:hypothetical protein
MQDLQFLISATETGKWDKQTQKAFVVYITSRNPKLSGTTINQVTNSWKSWGPKITAVNGVEISEPFTPNIDGAYKFANMVNNTKGTSALPPPVTPEIPGSPHISRTDNIAHLRVPDSGTASKLLIISPGIDNAYGWSSAADDHAARAASILPSDVAYVVAKSSRVPIDAVLTDISRDPKLSRISNIEVLGFSGGGNTTLQFMKNSSNAGKIKKFYLADPYWGNVNTADVPYPSKTTLVFNPSNWASKYNIKPKFDRLSSSVISGGGESENTSLGHVAILDNMLSKV